MYKKVVLGIVTLSFLSAAGWGLYVLGERHGVARTQSMTDSASGSAVNASDPASNTGKKILYYHDPMVPGTRFDKPGKSPFMDMQLVPVYADSGAASGSDNSGITVNARAQQNLGIRTAEVVTGTLARGIDVVGSVAWNERDIAVVPARANGYVEKLFVRATLDPVAKGQAIAALYVPEWVAAQEEYLAVRRISASDASHAGTASLVEGARQRMRLAGMSDAQIARVESLGKVEPRITMVAPIAGVIAELGVREGAAITIGTPIVRINGLSTVWINAELPESLAAQLMPGSRVAAKSPDGTVVVGKVSALLPEVNAQTRTLKVRIEVDNAQRKLLPGMFATLNFKPSARDDMLLIPSEAVIATGTRTIVMVAEGGGRFKPVEIEPGVESGGRTEIKKGLKAGQRVVLSGQFLLDSEASLTGLQVNRGDAPPADAAPSAKDAPRFQGTGKVDSIDKDEVTLSHGPIAALKWNAMTMGFRAPANGVPKDVAVGSTVDFEIRPMDDGQYQIVSIRPHAETKAKP